MNVPFTAIHFTAYESSKVFLQELKGDGGEVEEETFFVQFTAGGVAGGLAAAVTTPLDVVKTRMQAGERGNGKRGTNDGPHSQLTPRRRMVADRCLIIKSFN